MHYLRQPMKRDRAASAAAQIPSADRHDPQAHASPQQVKGNHTHVARAKSAAWQG